MTKADKIAWLDSMKAFAQAEQRNTGIPASVVLAQAFCESADKLGNPGQCVIARECNNYFGIKLGRATAPYRQYCTAKDASPKNKFRVFKCVADSFAFHARLLSTDPRYAPAMEAVHDPLAFAAQLQICGYSENPQYASKLLGPIIREYHLEDFDLKEGV
jgi:flagellar protein FlgJ